jgi:predicted anti-sigma-YlaC factor YlaD
MNIGITCKKAVDYISKKEEGKLSSWQRVQLWRHLAVCSLCRTFANQNSTIGAMFSRHGEHHHLTEDEKKQMINNVLGEK